MEPNSWNNLGHSNRIFSLKFSDENTLISGGWDSNVYLFKLDSYLGYTITEVSSKHLWS